MKCAILGNGSMGKSIQTLAKKRGHSVAAIVDRDSPWDLHSADIVFEVTTPDSCINNIRKLCAEQKDSVIVTTGWYDRMEEVQDMVRYSGIRALWSSNFSIGVNIYFRIIESATKYINKAEEYDIWGTEIHHRNKVDSPSGTAKTLENILLKNINRKNTVVEEKLDRKIEYNEIHFSSVRGGEVNFGHTIGFDSHADTIKIEHSARNRNGYALGAVKSAEWLQTQKPGLYDMDTFLKNYF
jgi:4-hydroxy-tetrahydrodipicolinate reductase